MRKISKVMLALMLLLSTTVFGQLTGIKNIPGDYATLTTAIADLNTQGVGSGGVTFSLLAGYTEIFTTSTAGVITATGTATSPIIFMKNGAGANPLITAATGVSSDIDGIIVIKGGDYISFYNIDLMENSANITPTTQMEWGYAILKASVIDGAKNININGCAVTLTQSNTASVGIYANNHTEANTTLLTITDVLGTNQNIKINGNSISNCYQGMYVKGSTTLAYYDSGLEIGSTAGNTISNYGGSTVATNGVYVNGQNAPKIEKNSITLPAGTTAFAYGINVDAACIGDLTINLNRVSVSLSATTSQLTAINNAAPIATVVNITNNTIENCNYLTATTGNFYGIYEQGATTGCTVNITGDTIKNNVLGSLTTAGSGFIYLIYVTSGSPTAVNVNNNIISGNVNSGTTGGFIYGIYINKGTTQTANSNKIFDNTIVGTGIGGFIYGIRSVTGTIVHNFNNIYNNSIAKATATVGVNYGIYNMGSPTNETYNSNNIYNLTSQGTNNIGGIHVTTSAGTRTVANNTIYGLSSNGSIYGLSFIYSSTTAYKNKIYNLSGNGTPSAVYGIYLSSGTTNTVYNNFISDLKAPTANLVIAISGIYVAGGIATNLYYNTIYLNATSAGALFGTAGIYASTATTIDMRNNIVANTSTPMGANGYAVAYRRSSATIATHTATSNNNCYYAGTPGTNNVIYYDGTTGYVNFVDIAPVFGTKDNLSFSEMPPFVNIATAPYNLKIQSVVTKCESGGQRITTPAIPDDYEGTLRFGEVGYVDGGSATDVGADEFIGISNFTCVAPIPGNTIASANALCLGNSTVLSLQNVTAGTGVSYQWQSSFNGTNYTNGATTATWTVTPTEATYYKCIVTCNNGPVSGTSTPIQITFNQTAPTTTSGARCGTGVVPLAASIATGTLKWYTAAIGGASFSTGSAYNANISSTTTYYVGADNSIPANITLGVGTYTSTSSQSPFYHVFGGLKSQYLIKASELISAGLSAGNLSALSFNIAAANIAYSNFNLSVGSTLLNNLTTTLQTGLTTVYSSASVTPTVGIYTITFATPYLWDGTSNIIIETCWSNNNTGGTGATVRFDVTSFNATSCYYADSQTAATLCAGTTASGTLTTRPQMIFAGYSTCSSPRSPVTATSNTAPALTVSADQTVCNNTVAAINVISPLANYDTYVWTPATGLFTDAAATTPYVDGASAIAVYAKMATAGVTNYVCYASNALLCAKTDTVAVVVLPSTPIITAFSSPICVSGTSALNVAPAIGYGAATFQWNSSANNVSFSPIIGHTTLNEATDVLTSTTYYKLTIKDGAGNTCVEPTVSVIVNNPQVLTTTPATRCGIGTATLGATVSIGVASKWYATATSDTVLVTGNSFTTPIISATTDYYVAAETVNSTITLGNGSATSSDIYTPFNGSYGGIKTQHLFTSAELQAAGLTAGNINNVALNVTVAGTTYNGFTIQMGNTLLNDFTATANIQGGLTTVYSAPSAIPTVGINAYSFTAPFVWDGTSNVIVSISWSNANISNPASTVKVNPTTNYSSQSYRADSQTAAFLLAFTGPTIVTGTLATSMNRPQIKFNYQPLCANGRTLVTATVIPASILTISGNQIVCNNAVATIGVTSTLANYDTYIWTPVANLYTDAAATIPYVAGASATTVYVKSIITGANVYTCNASNVALCATNTTSTVMVRSAINITTNATSASICAGGSSDLTAIVSQTYPFQSVPSYVFSTATNPFIPLVGGTASTATGDDGTQTAIPIGFDFTFNGNNFSAFSISTNGVLKLGTSANDFTNALATMANVIAPMWDDNNIGVGAITYLVTGTAPNRVLTVDWNNVSIGGGGSVSGSTNQYQVQLFEGSNNIQFNYGSLNSTNGITASIGISGNAGQFISVTPNVATTASTVTENTTISSVANIPSGTSYLFTSNEVHSFAYSWEAGATEIATTLSTTVSPTANTNYTFSVLDGNACSVISPVVTVNVSAVTVALTPVNVTCNGGNDGSFAEGAITCGTAPLTYSVDGGVFGPIPTNLTAGTHDVIVRDAGLNISTPVSLVISQPAPIEITTVGSPVVVCQGATSAVVSATTSISVVETTITVPFDVTVQPIEVNATPGSIVATATLPPIPAGSTITNVTLSYPGIISNGFSYQSEVLLGFSGAIVNTEISGIGAASSNGTFDYTGVFATPTISFAGGNVNLLYWNTFNDVAGDDATFPVGLGVATLTITYTPAAPITWYNAATGGSLLGIGATLETIGTTELPNGNTPGTYNFYAEGSHGTCISPSRAMVSVIVSAPSVGGTATASVNQVCSGTGTSISLTGNTGNIQWQSSTDGTTWNNVAGETTATLVTGNLTAKTYYQAVVTSGTCASTFSSIDSVRVITAPVSGTLTGGATVCSDANSTLLMLTGYTGTVFGWESSLDGISWTPFNNPADNYNATNLTATTHYRAKVVNGICSVYSNEVVVTVTPLPTANISYANAPFCSSNAASEAVTLVGTTGGVYSSTTGLTIDGATGAIIPSTSTPGAYLVTYTIAAAGGCGVISDDTTIVITTAPTANISYTGTPFCSSNSVVEAVALVGTTGGVYNSTIGLTIDASTGGINPSTSTPGSYLVTYTIAAAGGCNAVMATTSVIITALPTATIAYTGSPWYTSAGTQAVILTGTNAYSGGTYSSTAGLSIDATTGQITPSTSTPGSYVVTYTIAAATGCGMVTETANVVINSETCNAPTALVVSSINVTGASLSWTNGGTETAWNIHYKKVADATYTNVANTSTKPYILTALQPSSAYVWNVQAVCSGMLTSIWSADNTFTTTVGIENNSLSALKVYSYENQVNVINNGTLLVKEVVIYDVLGQEVGKFAINSTDNILINTNLTIGNYVVKVITAQQVGTYKLFIK